MCWCWGCFMGWFLPMRRWALKQSMHRPMAPVAAVWYCTHCSLQQAVVLHIVVERSWQQVWQANEWRSWLSVR
jgi:hypothetical protein